MTNGEWFGWLTDGDTAKVLYAMLMRTTEADEIRAWLSKERDGKDLEIWNKLLGESRRLPWK